MITATVALTSVLAMATACGAGAVRTGTLPTPPAQTAPAGEARPGLPTVPDDNRKGLPRVDGTDVSAPPQITTRTTVLADNRPATVVTLAEAVLFAFGSADLRPDAEPALQAVADLFRPHPKAQAEVAGHTDSVGSAAYNQMLSQRRAAAVVDWLVDHGVARNRLDAVGYGATRPVAGNATEDDRRRNRRVELTIRNSTSTSTSI